MYQQKSNRKLIVIFLLLAVVILAAVLVIVGIRIQQSQQPPDTGAADGVCNFIAAGDNFDDGWHDDYLVSMRNYLTRFVPNTDYYGNVAIPGTAAELFDKYEGIFYLSGNTNTLATNGQLLDQYLALGGNTFMLTDHDEWNIYTNPWLAKYGVVVSGAQPVGSPFVRPAPGLDPKNAGVTRLISSTAGNVYYSGNSSLVTEAACQYYWGEGTFNPTGTDCAWMQLKLVGGGTLNVIASFGSFGGAKVQQYTNISDPSYQQYIIGLLDGYAHNLSYRLSFNYCTTGGAPLPALCGNGQLDDQEQCDDGNVINGDGCSLNCQITTQCNDGVDNDGDGNIDCQTGNEDPGCFPDGLGGGGACNPTDNTETDTVRVCGNGVIETGETCDDSNTTNGDGCSSLCQTTTQCNDGVDNDGDNRIDCQDGIEDPGCFPDGAGGGGACNPTDNAETDTPIVCGDGVIGTGEQCDDGNAVGGDGCSALCQTTTQCNDGIDNDGDGTLDCNTGNPDLGCFPDGAGGGGTCDPDDNNETDGSICGNGVVNAGEACDDGNTTNGDSCSATCTITTQCNDGIDNDGDGRIDCTAGNPDLGCFPDGAGGGGACNPTDNTETDGAAVCGNGVLNTGEACDDGNTVAGDGCSATCQLTTQCNDGVDNDGDGDIDCQPGNEDPGCFPNGAGGGGACDPNDGTESNTPPQCSDGIDNDGDGRIDCQAGNEDPGCFPNGAGGGGACNPNDGSESNLPNTALGSRESLMVVMLGILMMLGGVAVYRFNLAEKWFPNSGKFSLPDLDETTGARFSDFETGAEIRARSKAKRR